MLNILEDTKKDQRYVAKDEVEELILFTDDKNMTQQQKKKKLQELTKALAVMGVKPSTFHCYHTAGRVDKVKELLETALRKRTQLIVHQKKPIHIEYEIDDKYNPHVDIDADLPTLHEAFQFLMKIYVDDINTRKKMQRGMKKASALSKTMQAFGDAGSGALMKLPPTTKKTLTSNGIIEVSVESADPEEQDTDNKIKELRKMLENKNKSARQRERERLRNFQDGLKMSQSSILDNINRDLDYSDDPFKVGDEQTGIVKTPAKKRGDSLEEEQQGLTKKGIPKTPVKTPKKKTKDTLNVNPGHSRSRNNSFSGAPPLLSPSKSPIRRRSSTKR